jgi:hypothetical protein
MTREVLYVSKPKVISEAFEDEVVAINLETGTYFGMGGTAKEVWTLIEGEITVDAIASAVAERYKRPHIEIAAALQPFTDSLLAHGLVAVKTAEASVPATQLAGEAGIWETPKLTVYDDMKDLLLLDPIHDVDETGWPARKQDSVS